MNKVEFCRPCGGWKTDDGKMQKAKLSNLKFENPKIRGVIKFEEGDEIEVKWRPSADYDYLWYSATIQNINWDYFVCEFKYKNVVNRDIFERPFMRLKNPNPIIKQSDFYTAEIEIPEDLHDFCYVNTHCHDEFKRAIKAVNIEFGNGILRIMTTYDLTKKLDIIKDLHVKQLYEKMILSFKLNQVQEELECNKANSFIDKFAVPSDLLKLVKTSQNLTKARAMDEIFEIELDEEESQVIIFGKSCESVAQAREMIEFEEKNYVVPRSLVSRIIGQKGKQIQEIIDRSNIAKVRFPSDHETRSILNMSKSEITRNAIIILIGTKDANENACTMMDYLVGSLNEIQAMHKQHKRLDSQLVKIKTQKPSNEKQLSNQNSSGYSSDSSRYSTTSGNSKNRRRGGRRGRGARKNSDNQSQCPTNMSDYGTDNITTESDMEVFDRTSQAAGCSNQTTESKFQAADLKDQKVEEWLNSNSSQVLNKVIEETDFDFDNFGSLDWADDPIPDQAAGCDAMDTECSYGPCDVFDNSGNRCGSPFPSSNQSESTSSDQSNQSEQSSISQSDSSKMSISFSQSDQSVSSTSSQSTPRRRNRRGSKGNQQDGPGRTYSDLAKTKSNIEKKAEKQREEAQIRALEEMKRLANQKERLIVTLKGSKWAKSDA